MRIRFLLSLTALSVAVGAGSTFGEQVQAPTLQKAQQMLEDAFLEMPSENRKQALTIKSMKCTDPISDGQVVPCHIDFEMTSIFPNMPVLNKMKKYSADLTFYYDLFDKYVFRGDIDIQMCDEFGNKCTNF